MARLKGEPSVSVITQKALGFIFSFAHQIPMVGLCKMLDDLHRAKLVSSPSPLLYTICVNIQNTLSLFVRKLQTWLMGSARPISKTYHFWTVFSKSLHAQTPSIPVSIALGALKPLSGPLRHSILSVDPEAGFVPVHICRRDSCPCKKLDCRPAESHDARSRYLPRTRKIRCVPFRCQPRWYGQVEVSIHASQLVISVLGKCKTSLVSA